MKMMDTTAICFPYYLEQLECCGVITEGVSCIIPFNMLDLSRGENRSVLVMRRMPVLVYSVIRN